MTSSGTRPNPFGTFQACAPEEWEEFGGSVDDLCSVTPGISSVALGPIQDDLHVFVLILWGE